MIVSCCGVDKIVRSCLLREGVSYVAWSQHLACISIILSVGVQFNLTNALLGAVNWTCVCQVWSGHLCSLFAGCMLSSQCLIGQGSLREGCLSLDKSLPVQNALSAVAVPSFLALYKMHLTIKVQLPIKKVFVGGTLPMLLACHHRHATISKVYNLDPTNAWLHHWLCLGQSQSTRGTCVNELAFCVGIAHEKHAALKVTTSGSSTLALFALLTASMLDSGRRHLSSQICLLVVLASKLQHDVDSPKTYSSSS